MTRKNYDGWCLWHPKKGYFIKTSWADKASAKQLACEALFDPKTEWKGPSKTWGRLQRQGYKIVKVKLQKVG